MTVLDAAGNVVLTQPTGGDDSLGIAIDANTVVITNYFSNDATVISLSGGEAIVPVGTEPKYVALNPTGALAYVSNRGTGIGANSVSVIDIATRTVTATISTDRPSGVAVTPDGALLYVTNELRTPSRCSTPRPTP